MTAAPAPQHSPPDNFQRWLVFALLLPALIGTLIALTYRGTPATQSGVTSENPPASPHEAKVDFAPPAPKTDEIFWPAEVGNPQGAWTGRLARIDAHLAILTVRGSAEARGTAHGQLLREEVGRLVKSVRAHLKPDNSSAAENTFQQLLDGARRMKQYLDADVIVELEACAKASGVNADELLLAQLFGDVNRALKLTSFCTVFAAFGPATSDGGLLIGRNFDYSGKGLDGGVPLILQEIPTGPDAGRPFVTIGYAGILNGWTALNADGLFASNNTLFYGKDSLDGIATCFLLRKIVERARNVEDGVALIEKGPRACTTGMLVAGKNKAGSWDARFVEFDSEKTAIVEPQAGRVLSSNSCQKLSVGGYIASAEPNCSRWKSLKEILEGGGPLNWADTQRNPIAAKGVYLGINLHCAYLNVPAQRFRLAVSPGDGTPAATHAFREFQIEADRVVEVQP